MARRAPQRQARRTPEYVRFAPGDDGAFLNDIFYTHPDNWTPVARPPYGNKIRAWGLYKYEDDDPVPGVEWGHPDCFKRMMAHNMYTRFMSGSNLETPERQFVKRLVEKKRAQLKTVDLGDLTKRDYILRLTLPDATIGDSKETYVWRKFRVSGGISLSVFSDKILTPLVGWCRNLHTHVFYDHHDGAVFGIKQSTSVDQHWIINAGYEALDEKEFVLAHILREVGDTMEWIYDLGDNWAHEITVEEIVPADQSTNAVVVLDGRGVGPPENTPIPEWRELLEAWGPANRPNRRRPQKVLKHFSQAENYKQLRPLPINDPTFDVHASTVAKWQKAIDEVLQTPNSDPTHPTMFKGYLNGFSEPMGTFSVDGRKAPVITRAPVGGHSHSVMETSMNTKHDSKSRSACANCGSPHNLKQCSACKKILYCSGQCQKTHWPTHKPICRSSSSS